MRLFELIKKLFAKAEPESPVHVGAPDFVPRLPGTREQYNLIIRSIIATGERLELDELIDLLIGTGREKFRLVGLVNNPYYGCLREIGYKGAMQCIVDLVRKNFLSFQGAKTRVLQVTIGGSLFLEEKDMTIKKITRSKKEPTTYVKPQEYRSQSFQRRVERLHAQGKKNAYLKWNREEELELIRAYKSGVSIKRIAKQHMRTEGAIRKRLEKLKLI